MMGTPADDHNLQVIKEKFPNAKITKPAANCYPSQKKKSMAKYFKMVDKADRVVIAAADHKKNTSSGVFSEAQHGLHQGKTVLLVEGYNLTKVKGFDMNVKDRNPAVKWAKIKTQKKKL